MDLRRVNPVQRRQLTRRLHFPHCRQCHLRLERRRMNLPCPGHHDLPFLVMVFYLNHWSRFWGPPYLLPPSGPSSRVEGEHVTRKACIVQVHTEEVGQQLLAIEFLAPSVPCANPFHGSRCTLSRRFDCMI